MLRLQGSERPNMMIGKPSVRIYGAGKTWSAPIHRNLRDVHGFHVISRWIDAQQVLKSPDDEFPPEVHANEAGKRDIWAICREDCLAADMGLLVCDPADENMHSGSLVELGHITAFGKPVYIIGTCASVEPAGNSDRAWKSQPCVYYWPDMNPVEGAEAALDHYLANYTSQFIANRGFATSREIEILRSEGFIPHAEAMRAA